MRFIVIDGEIVCLDVNGKPCFQTLQGFKRAQHDSLFFYAFDLLHLDGRDLLQVPLAERKEVLRSLLNNAPECLRFSAAIDADPEQLIEAVRHQGLEGILAKHRNSFYEPGQRTGAWMKFKTERIETFVIGGYRPGATPRQFRFAPGGICRWTWPSVLRNRRGRIHAISAPDRWSGAGDAQHTDLPFRKSAAALGWPVGRRHQPGRDEPVRLAEAESGRRDPFHRMDGCAAVETLCVRQACLNARSASVGY